MTRLLEHAMAAANTLPSDAQDDIARVILRLTGADDEMAPVPLSADERAAIEASKAAATRGRSQRTNKCGRFGPGMGIVYLPEHCIRIGGVGFLHVPAKKTTV